VEIRGPENGAMDENTTIQNYTPLENNQAGRLANRFAVQKIAGGDAAPVPLKTIRGLPENHRACLKSRAGREGGTGCRTIWGIRDRLQKLA